MGRWEIFAVIFNRHFNHPASVWARPWGLVNNAHTRLQATSVSHVLETCVKRSQLGRGELLESTQEKGQKG